MIKIIFLGNGMLADGALAVLERHFEVVFHARSREDLAQVKSLKRENPELHAVLASYGAIIRSDVLELFEPEGILNIHPSRLPKYRGASPIESAILAGDTEFGVSVMKLARAMDAGPIYYQTTLSGLPLEKAAIYQALAEAGAQWIVENLTQLPTPVAQNENDATFTTKISKDMGAIDPSTESAEEILRKIVAFQGFPKVRFAFCGVPCLILAAHRLEVGDTAPLTMKAADGAVVAIDQVQPEGRRAMDAQSFLNGYGKKLN